MSAPVWLKGRTAGIVSMLAASVCYAAMAAFIKSGLGELSVMGVVFWRSVVVASVSSLLIVHGRHSFKPGDIKWLTARSLMGFSAMACFFFAISRIELGTANTLVYTSPILTTLLSSVVLKEKLHKRSLPLVVLGFVGVLLIIRPGSTGLDLGTGLGLFAGVLAACSYIAVRKLRSTDPPARIVFWFAVVSMVLSATWVVGFEGLGGLMPASSFVFWALLVAGLAASGGQLLMTWAYRLEQAQVVGPYSYFTVLCSFVLGWVFWSERPTWLTLVGMGCVVVAGALISGLARAQDPNDLPEPEKNDAFGTQTKKHH